MVTRLFLVRHCQATGQAADAPLTHEGETQSLQLAEFLADAGIEHLVSSPFTRAHTSIEPLAFRLGRDVEIDLRLAERVLAAPGLPDWREYLRASFDDVDLCLLGGESSRAATTRAALALHEWQGEVIEPGRYAHYVCEQLVVPSVPGSEGRPTPEVVARVRAGVAPWRDAGASPGGERIYVTREQARRRRVANEAELWAQLERRGFVKLRLEELTWREQIHAFRRAKVVVAPHGAGLANLVFCEAGTRVVEFFNRAYVNGNFWRLAALRGLDYRPVVGAGAEPLAQIAAQGRENIMVDVSAVMRAV